MALWEIKVEIDPEFPDQVEDILAERNLEGWHLYQEPWVREISLTGYFETEELATETWETLADYLPAGVVLSEPEVRELEDAEWQDSYKAHFHSWQFGHLHWVPVWERESFIVPEGDEVVWLDPGMAFGTGNHETTRLCVERILECRRDWLEEGRDLARASVIDAGCGSGILAISAVKYGFGEVAAFDLDPLAVRVSEENAGLNELEKRIEFYVGNLEVGLRGRQADLVVANILANVLSDHAETLWAAVKPGGRLVLSGILAVECVAIQKRFEKAAPDAKIEAHELGEWADLLLIKKS